MIHELITDIAYDRITVAQGLTRAKLIANQIKNETFKNWLSKELNGYTYDDKTLPEYRKVWSEIELTAEFPYGQVRTFPVVLPDDADETMKDLIYHHRFIEPIYVVEQNITEMEGSSGSINLPGGMVRMLAEFYGSIKRQGGQIRTAHRTIGKSHMQNIVQVTKQKLLDTLQELENQFPQIDKNYVMNEDNKEKAQNIITNNIYGNNNPLNVAAGEQITQGDINLTINAEQVEKLKEFGVEDEAIEELKTIDKENPKGSSDRKGKIMSWLGRVTASMTAKGVYENMPELIEFVGNLI
ncbi:hypothetical protein ACOCEA_17895 [Maribacter sp. CXY002]|uniref:AbiTii domain-containing protein n=1 Tax=Maribacter luteocoastalis TaxID=3407671 RepID=UPI003B66C46F